LLARAAVCGFDHHQCHTSGRGRLVPDDGLFRDRARSCGTKGAQPHLKGAPRPRVSLSNDFLVRAFRRYGTPGSIAKKGADR